MFWLLYIVISVIIIGTFIWSTRDLIRQKKAWEQYARRHKLNFKKGKFFSPPQIEGFIGNYRASFFTAERREADPRDRRFLSVIELQMPEGTINGIAAGTIEMVPFIESLNVVKPYNVQSKKWDKTHRIYCQSPQVLDLFFSKEERVDALRRILRTKNADVLFLSNNDQGIVRLETRDALFDPDKTENIIQNLIKQLEILALEKKERRELEKRMIAAEEAAEQEFNKDPPADT